MAEVERSRYRGSGRPGEPVERNPGAAERIPPDPRGETARQRLTATVWNVAWEATRRLPESVALLLGEALGRAAHRLGGAARQRVRRNLARVVAPDVLDEAVRDAFRSYARYWVEAFRAADMDPADLDRRTTTRGFEHLDAALEGGRGAIVLLAHHGSWDLAAQWAESHGYHLAVVAEVVRPRRLFEKFVRAREAVGLEVVPLRRGQAVVGRLEEVLAANHIVGLLADRDLTRKGPVVEFFGEACRLPPGPVVLSRKTGAPIVPATMMQRPGRSWHVEVLESFGVQGLDLEAGCARMAVALQDLIGLDPAQWHMFQPLWLADQPRRVGDDHSGSGAGATHPSGDWVQNRPDSGQKRTQSGGDGADWVQNRPDSGQKRTQSGGERSGTGAGERGVTETGR